MFRFIKCHETMYGMDGILHGIINLYYLITEVYGSTRYTETY